MIPLCSLSDWVSWKLIILTLSRLEWNDHCQFIFSKATKCLNRTRRVMYGFTQAAKFNAYKVLVRPHLEYACAVWSPYMAKDISLLESMQHRAARWILSFWDSSDLPISSLNLLLFVSLNWGGPPSKLVGNTYPFGLFTPSFIRKQRLIFLNIFVSTHYLQGHIPLC